MAETCSQKMVDAAVRIAAQSRKAAEAGPSGCISIFNKGIEALRAAMPPGKSLICEQIIKGHEAVTTQYGRGLECARSSASSRRQRGQIVVEDSAQRATKGVVLHTYLCDDMDVPLSVSHHKTVAAARKVAETEPGNCHFIEGRGK